MIDDSDIAIVNKICKSVGGPISEKEVLFLYELAKEVKDGVIVEIGAAQGRSTICLAMGSKAGYGVKVYSIDPHAGSMYTPDPDWMGSNDPCKSGIPDIKYYIGQGKDKKPFLDNIKKWDVESIVIPIIDYSELAYKNFDNGHGWGKDIGLLFIDGDHRYSYVKLDIQLWTKHVTSGGKIVFHDYPYPGVCGAINELIIGNPRYCNFIGVGIDPIVNVTVRDKKEEK